VARCLQIRGMPYFLYYLFSKLFITSIIYVFLSIGLGWSADLTNKPNCEKIANRIESETNLPIHLLSSISRVEAGRKLSSGEVKGWPWSINHAGKGLYFETKKGALKYLKNAVSNGSKNIDVGCMQLNYRWHKGAFSSLDDMFDPEKNIQYAAKFVKELYGRHQNWKDVIKHYHSNKKKFNVPYYQKVSKVWNKQKENKLENNPLGFTAAENILPAVENKTIFKKEIEPIIVYDASSHINIVETDQVLNESGLNFKGDNKNLTINSPLNVPKFIKKHWSLVLSLRQQLEKD
tara:strand:- start:1135 stop:2007 length:873 start_codon:yes stop_codon:yes gene_type:complete